MLLYYVAGHLLNGVFKITIIGKDGVDVGDS